MGADHAKLLEAGEKLTEQLQSISNRMEKISQQNEKLLSERKDELRSSKGTTPKQTVHEGQIGNISEFNSKYKWSHWYERFEFFCTVNNINPEKKKSLFLVMIGNEGYSLLKNLCTPEVLRSKSFTELSKIMKDYLEPESNTITERYNFKERKQLEQERIKDYVTSLKSLAVKCNFQNVDCCLRDQLIWGLRSRIIKQKLLNEVNLTFKKAVDIATSMENNVENSKINDHKNAMNDDNTSENSKIQSKNKITCYCCGQANHTRNNCPLKNSVCHRCGLIGHLSKICQKKRLIGDNNLNHANNSKNTSIENNDTQNSCSREHGDEHHNSFYSSERSSTHDRDEVKNCYPSLNQGFWKSHMANGEVITSPTQSNRFRTLTECSYCQVPIQNVTKEIFKLQCTHIVHQSCYRNFHHIMKCQLCVNK